MSSNNDWGGGGTPVWLIFLLCFIYIQFLHYGHVYVNFRVNAMYMYVLIIQQ